MAKDFAAGSAAGVTGTPAFFIKRDKRFDRGARGRRVRHGGFEPRERCDSGWRRRLWGRCDHRGATAGRKRAPSLGKSPENPITGVYPDRALPWRLAETLASRRLTVAPGVNLPPAAGNRAHSAARRRPSVEWVKGLGGGAREVLQDAVDDALVVDEGHDPHDSATTGTKKRVHLQQLPQQPRPSQETAPCARG